MKETSSHSRQKKVQTIVLTEARCRDLGPGEYQDKGEPALRFYVSDKGARSFGVYKWSPEDRMAIRKSLGKWAPGAGKVEQARIEARKTSDLIREGKLTKATKEAQKAERATTLEHVLDLYTKKLKREGKTKWKWAEDAMKHSYKDWMKLPLSKITRLMISNKQDEIAFGDEERGIKARGPAAAAVSLKALRAVYTRLSNIAATKYNVEPRTNQFKAIVNGVESPAWTTEGRGSHYIYWRHADALYYAKVTGPGELTAARQQLIVTTDEWEESQTTKPATPKRRRVAKA